MRVSDTEKNRGAHGDSSFKLGGMPSSSENPPALAVGECQWETPICLSDHIKQAIEAIKFFSNRLCDACGVCPADKKNPFNCEIAGTDHE